MGSAGKSMVRAWTAETQGKQMVPQQFLTISHKQQFPGPEELPKIPVCSRNRRILTSRASGFWKKNIFLKLRRENLSSTWVSATRTPFGVSATRTPYGPGGVRVGSGSGSAPRGHPLGSAPRGHPMGRADFFYVVNFN